MSIILQVSAWVILAVGYFALGHKFFPNLKNWFTTGKVSYVWLISITLGLFVLLTYPIFFNWWAVNFWNVPENELTDFTKLGPLGDIYGSLNTIVSSIALCAIAFTTYLQVISLKETRKITTEQMDESRNAIFATKFYALLNYKDEKLKTLSVKRDGIEYFGCQIFDFYFCYFDNLFKKEWKELTTYIEQDIYSHIRKCDLEVNDGKEFSDWYAHFLQIANLIDFINTSDLTEKDKDFYFNVLRSSMTMREQITLFWIAPVTPQVYAKLKNGRIFNLFFNKKLVHYGIQFYQDKNFESFNWQKVFDEKKETLA